MAAEDRLPDEAQTVLLSDRRQECSPCLVNTQTGEADIIEKLPHIIGSLSGHTDFTIKSGNISRLHAEIRERDGKICVVDLNSTNGTRVNGKTLLPGEECVLFENDRIDIADMEFIYKEGN